MADAAKVCRAVSASGAQSLVFARYIEKYRDLPTSGQCRVAGTAMQLANAKGMPLIGPALFAQLYLPASVKR
jgi:hypothetical protein